ncbi:hypothetical protein FHS29_004815 [Saccharothrix tamanrassetensis]|uniref:Secreted protein n=1 Tax=Saccharothrix tamanrassetensis TaxID=1051531 RepID=A0A841CQ66_9PSEU|nr:hypothetical protein [Saccharothrix tamanrassetensis]MBB5958207.1 hypothetical protein [Saccharothrix tamanrassetensis]
MNPIIAQALTIAGVLLGSAATFVVTSTTERTRWRRAQSARWDDKRLLAYSEYANAVKPMVRLCRRIAETKGLLSTGEPVDLGSAFADLAEAETERAARWETVLLLGEPATISAARAWSEQVWRLEHILRDDQPDASAFIDAYRNAMRLRNEFYDRARTDLDITSGPLPELTWKSLQPQPPPPDHPTTP